MSSTSTATIYLAKCSEVCIIFSGFQDTVWAFCRLSQTVVGQIFQEIFPKTQMGVKRLFTGFAQLSLVKGLLLKPAEILQPVGLKVRLRWKWWSKISCVQGWLGRAEHAVQFKTITLIFIGKSELTGQPMGGFENLIAPCLGKGIKQDILFLVELSGMQPHHPDSNSSTAQISLVLHVRAVETFVTMEPNN